MIEKIPMGRTGTVEEMAAMIAWLASKECSFTTGAVFDVQRRPSDILNRRRDQL